MDTSEYEKSYTKHGFEIFHNGDVEHGLLHFDNHFDSPEIREALRYAKNSTSGVAEFRNHLGDKYTLKHLGGDRYGVEYAGRHQ